MKKIIFCIFMLFPLHGNCQNRWQTVNYNEVSVQLPSGWENKNMAKHYEDDNITEYQISAWDKNNTSNTLIIQWLDAELESDLYIKSMIESLQESFPMFRQLQFGEIIDLDFLGVNAKKCHFFGNIMKDVSIDGEFISFTRNGHSYMIIIGGNKNFYKSNGYNSILSSIKSNFSETVLPKENNTISTKADDNFTRYEFRNYSLSVPNTMELRNENSLMSLSKEIISSKLQSIKKIDIDNSDFIFQPAGTDDVQNSDNQKKALALYSRILVNYQKGTTGDYFERNGNITLSKAEYDELNKGFKDGLLQGNNKAKEIGMNMDVLKISDIKIAKNSNKYVYIEQKYERKGLNGNVKVIKYYVFNNDETVTLTISYRMSESYLWETDFEKIIDTFSFTNKKAVSTDLPKTTVDNSNNYQKLAEQGDADAQYNLGNRYYNGDGVEKSMEKAAFWWQEAAVQGLTAAQNNLGLCYYNGEGVEESKEDAAFWYQNAADRGNADAQCNLGLCYYKGEGVEQSFEKAIFWYKKATEQGHAGAQYYLGLCYYTGEGVEKSMEKAVFWWQKAADQGNADAQNCLRVCYRNGEIVK